MNSSFFSQLKSAVKEVGWPVLPTPQGASILSLLYQMDQSQWLPPDEIEELQLNQLGLLVAHAVKTVPYYSDALKDTLTEEGKSLTLSEWRQLPLLSRRDIQEKGASLRSDNIPPEHLPLNEVRSSGSTGTPIETMGTSVTALFWQALSLRGYLWHECDFTLKLAAIRHLPAGRAIWPGAPLQSWGKITLPLLTTGPGAILNINTVLTRQAEWLKREDPGYLLTYPSNLEALGRCFLDNGDGLPGLKGVITMGEALSSGVREVCRSAWDVPLIDMYSSQEVGYIALQCPRNPENYHLQSESLFVEILDDKGGSCRAGEVGRVVVTTLHNFAMPLLRYDIGDYAEVGGPCSCGRGLSSLKRIVGRVRNMITLPSGEKVWPTAGLMKAAKTFGIRQFQVIQHSLEDVEFKLVVSRPLSKDEEGQLKKGAFTALGHNFHIIFSYLDEIPRSAGGKFEDFISKV